MAELLQPGPVEGAIVEDIYRRYPGGEVEHRRRELAGVARPGSRSRGAVPVDLIVTLSDLIAVWLSVIHRP